MATLLPEGKQSFQNSAGAPLIGGKVYTYDAGTSTPRTTYQDAAGTTPNANPVILDARGEATIFWSGSYKVILKDSADVTIWTVDNVTDSSSGFLAFVVSLASSIGSSLVGFLQAGIGAVLRTVQSKLRETVSVVDFGADPTGVADSTAAFNLATQATSAFSDALRKSILIPDGTYKLNGTVYVRAGQTLKGSGHGVKLDCTGNAASASFILGYGLIAGVPTADNSGSPIKVEGFWTFGGNGSFATLDVRQAGFAINSVFMTAPGIGILFNGCGDGLVSNIEIDQCLNGMIFVNSQNISITNFNIYLPRYAFTFNNSCNDIEISNGTVEYTQYASVLFGDTSSNIKAITFSNVAFTMNAQYATFTGYVYSRASNVEAQFTGCSFRNMYGPAVNQGAGSGISLSFTGCVFDGTKTNAVYDQSTTSAALYTGVNGTYNFSSCEFRNLNVNIATINNTLTQLKIHGGQVVNCPQTRFTINATDVPKISIKGVTGFAFISTSGANAIAILPYWGGSTFWKLAVKGNTSAGSDTNYSAAEEALYSVTYQFNGASKLLFADKTLLWKTPTRTIPGDLGAAVCFGAAPGGAVSSAVFTSSGLICISVGIGAQANFDWFAETAV